MSWVAPVVQGGLTLAGLLRGSGGGRPVDINAIIEKWRNMSTTGTLSPEDYSFADRGYQSGAEKLGQRRTGRRAMAASSLAAKGLTLSGVGERLQQEDDSTDAGALTDLERNRQAVLYGTRMGRERYNQNFNLQGMLQEISGAHYNAARKDASTAGFMNSLLEAAPGVFDYFGGGGGGVPRIDITPAGYGRAHGGIGDIPLPDAPPGEFDPRGR